MYENLKSIDNKDDKREIRVLLEKLEPWERCRFLEWAVKQANQKHIADGGDIVKCLQVSNPTGTTAETFGDILMLSVQFKIPISFFVSNLEKLVTFRTSQIKGNREPGKLIIPDSMQD